MARIGQRGYLVLRRFGFGSSHIVFWRLSSEAVDDSFVPGVCEGSFERKLSTSVPMVAMLVGMVTLLGALLWVSSTRQGSG